MSRLALHLLVALMTVGCGGSDKPPKKPDPKGEKKVDEEEGVKALLAALEKEDDDEEVELEREGDEGEAEDDEDEPGEKAKKKKKKKKKKKPATAAQRAERYCAATCARQVRCDDSVDDEDKAEVQRTCRRDCRRGDGARTTRLRNAFVFAYATCFDALRCDLPRERCRDEVAAEVLAAKKASKQAYLLCEGRRKACGSLTERCLGFASANPGIRRAMVDCLDRPCGQLDTCLRDAAWR